MTQHASGRWMPALSEEDIRIAFASNGWDVRELVERPIELQVGEGATIGKYCWFARMHRA